MTLLQAENLLDYRQVSPDQALQAIETSIANYRLGIEAVVEHQAALPTWDDLVLAIDALDADLQGTFYDFAPMANHSVEWWQVFQKTYVQVDGCFKDKLRNVELYQLYERFANSAVGQHLDSRKKATLALILQEYKNGGVNLGTDDKARLQQLERRIGELTTRFLANVDSSVASLAVHVTDENRLDGIAGQQQGQMRSAAQAAKLSGWLIACDEANFTHVLKFATDRSLREQVYRAYHLQGVSDDPALDNGEVIRALAELRNEKARLLGFEDHVQLSVQTKSIGTVARLEAFLQSLEDRVKPAMSAFRSTIEPLAAAHGIDALEPWDIDYLHANARDSKSLLSEATMQEFFTFEGVVAALREMARQLFGVELQQLNDSNAWHPSVLLFEVIQDHATIGHLYLDALQHDGKAPDTVKTVTHWHRRVDAEGRYHRVVVSVYSDVPQGIDGRPPLLDHLALKKLYHEFGHALHSLLVSTNNHVLSDTRRLGSDGVEVPSKLFECWVWDADYLASISAHYQDGRKLSSAELKPVLDKLQADNARSNATLLGRALLDLGLHGSATNGVDLSRLVTDSHQRTGLWPLNGFEKPLHGFTHLVTGYDAGFFGYLWADVHAWDLFSRFEAAGLLDQPTGQALLDEVLAPSVSRPFLQSIELFLGRPTDTTRFLKWSGLA
ncbi:M3 family metallopeptidase [Pseudomonas putida]|uniref:M3 family metallopeptidase n=1 Tax=Pseudomonas putida TaxID=303 RepID=A0A6I6Y615_PSEPU|nr:M3 family metallopeptidase [Pseudomonas putida]QHG67712.2 M3 family metallopeptidase [Pseudomonas putida]